MRVPHWFALIVAYLFTTFYAPGGFAEPHETAPKSSRPQAEIPKEKRCAEKTKIPSCGTIKTQKDFATCLNNIPKTERKLPTVIQVLLNKTGCGLSALHFASKSAQKSTDDNPRFIFRCDFFGMWFGAVANSGILEVTQSIEGNGLQGSEFIAGEYDLDHLPKDHKEAEKHALSVENPGRCTQCHTPVNKDREPPTIGFRSIVPPQKLPKEVAKTDPNRDLNSFVVAESFLLNRQTNPLFGRLKRGELAPQVAALTCAALRLNGRQ